MAAHKTTHPKVKPSVDIGASASGVSNPESAELPRGLMTAFGSNEREVVVAADGKTISAAFGGTKATTDAFCTAARRAKKRVFDCILEGVIFMISLNELLWKVFCLFSSLLD